MNLAYVVVSFPSNTETFVLREVNYIKERRLFDNLTVLAYKEPDPGRLNTEETSWLREAVYVRKRLLANAWALLRSIFCNFNGFREVLSLWLSEIPKLTLRDNARLLMHILAGFGVSDLVRARKVDHMHAHFSTASTAAFIAHVLTGAPFSFTAHASADIYLYSPFLQEKIRRASRIIAISRYNKEYLELISGYTIDPGKVTVIYNGVRIPARPPSKRTNGTPVLFMSASFTGFKGYGILFKALKKVKDAGASFFFHCAGNGPLFAPLEKMVADLGLQENVRLLGHQPLSVVEDCLSKADVFVSPSDIYLNGQRDGMPTAITEAMSYGLPVVSTYVSGIPEQVEDGVNGFLVPPMNVDSLADRLIRLIENPDLRASMGAAAYETAKSKFDQESTMQKICFLFRNIARQEH